MSLLQVEFPFSWIKSIEGIRYIISISYSFIKKLKENIHMKKTKEQKSMDAIERNFEYNLLSNEEKLQKLNAGKFRAAKQRKKLGNPNIPKNCIY